MYGLSEQSRAVETDRPAHPSHCHLGAMETELHSTPTFTGHGILGGNVHHHTLTLTLSGDFLFIQRQKSEIIQPAAKSVASIMSGATSESIHWIISITV